MKIAYYKCKICGKIVHEDRMKYHIINEHRINECANECFTFHHYEIFHSFEYYKSIPLKVLYMEV
jgi:hypothetical protein